MKDWHEGQKIVCINATVPIAMQGPKWSGSMFISKYLKVGQVYTIQEIAMIKYNDIGTDIGFLLAGINTQYTYYGMPTTDVFGEEYYHFWHGRFKPLEEEEKIEKLDISIFLGLLNDVNDGKVKFDDEDGGLKAPERILEPANE
jgi:hypothetical protein